MKRTRKSNRRNHRKRLGFEALEKRQLLAADFASGLVGAIDTGIAEQSQVQAAEVCPLEIEEVDQALEAALGNDLEIQPETELANQTDVATETGEVDSAQSAEIESSVENLDPRNLDLSDSVDGFAGTIGPESPTETLNFTAAADGLANIVVANSFEDSSLLLTATSEEGSEIEFELFSDDGFDSISFEVNQGESYQLTVASTQPDAAGLFQVTVGFEEFVDQHADVAGADSTELVFTENQTELTGKLEAPGDVDTFRATAPQSGEVTLELDELEEETRLNLNVTVTDSAGAVIAEGATNEFLRITFDATESEEFFVAVSGGQGQKGDYRFTLNLDPSSDAPLDEAVVDDEVATVETPAAESDPAEEPVADTTNEDVPEETLAVGETDDLTSDLADGDIEVVDVVDEVLDNETPLLENEPVDDLTSDQTTEVAADTAEAEQESAGDLVDEEVTEVIDQIEEVVDGVADDVTEIVDGAVDEISEIEGIEEVEDVLDEAADNVTEIVDGVVDEISEIEGIAEIEDEIEDVIDQAADDVAEIVDVVADEISELDDNDEIVEVIDEVSDDVTGIVDEVVDEISEIEGIAEIEDVFDDAADELTEVVDAISEEISEFEGISEIEEVLEETGGELSEIVDSISEEISEIEGVSEVADDVSDAIEDALADPEVEEAIDQVVDELEGLFDHEPEVVAVVEETVEEAAGQVIDDAVVAVNGSDNELDLSETVAVDEAETTIEEALPQAEPVADTTVEELVGELVVAPAEGDVEADLDADGVQESVDLVGTDGEGELADDNLAEEDEDEDDREFVWSFGPKTFDSFFESLSEARDEFGNEHGGRFGGWGRIFFRALRRI